MTNFICQKLKNIEKIPTIDYDVLSTKILTVFGSYAWLDYFSLSCQL